MSLSVCCLVEVGTDSGLGGVLHMAQYGVVGISVDEVRLLQ